MQGSIYTHTHTAFYIYYKNSRDSHIKPRGNFLTETTPWNQNFKKKKKGL